MAVIAAAQPAPLSPLHSSTVTIQNDAVAGESAADIHAGFNWEGNKSVHDSIQYVHGQRFVGLNVIFNLQHTRTIALLICI